MKKSLFTTPALAIAGMSLLVGAQTAAADTATDTFAVTATVANSCTVTAADLAFGTYVQTAGTATDATSAVAVNCTTGASYTVSLNAGAGTGATFATRIMESGSNDLNYTLYRNAAHTEVWGDGTSSSNTVTGTGNGAIQNLTVYGRVFADQSDTAPASSYSDTVTATVTY
jgi:spore coat protein U-like protein